MKAAPLYELYAKKLPGYPPGGMAVDGVARGAGVLPPDAAGFAAFLEETRLVDDQDAARFVPEALHDVAPQIVAHPKQQIELAEATGGRCDIGGAARLGP